MADDDLRPMSQEEIDALFAEANGGEAVDDPASAEESADDAEQAEKQVPDTGSNAAEAVAATEAEPDDAVGPDRTKESAASDQPDDAAEASASDRSDDAAEAGEVAEADQPAGADEAGEAGAGPDASESETGEAVSDTDESAADAEGDALSDGTASAQAAKVSQDDIDALLADLGADDGAEGDAEADAAAAQADAGTAAAPGGSGPNTAALTAESLADLVSKHRGEDGSATGTGVINQEDIDALVQQMSDATGTPVPDREEIAAAMEDRGEDIDALLDDAGAGVSMDDAVSPSLIRNAMSPQGAVASLPPGAVMSPEELRGTRYLLVAAVFLLMMCAVTLGFVVASVNGLTAELARSNQSQVTASDDFAEDIAVAERWLSDADPATVTKGVLFLEEELKQRYPKKQATIAERLGAHYRSTGAHQRAVEEFAYIADRTSGLVEDPQFYLDYADSLHRIGESQRAREVVYELVSNEAWFLREQHADGGPVEEAELARNRRVLQEAMILLGRLYSPVVEDEERVASTAETTSAEGRP